MGNARKPPIQKIDSKAAPVFYKHPFPTLWILIFLGCLSFFIQYITIEKLSVFSPAETFGTLTKYIQAIDAKVSFEWIDILLFVLYLATSALVLWQEISKRVLTDFLQNIFSSERKTLYLLLACSLVCVRFYFARGGMHWGADASHHIAQSYLVARAIADGELPIWTFLMGNGSPYMQNYGFAFFYLVGLVDFFCRDIFLSLKLVMGTSHVLSGIGMYYLASTLCQSRRAGFIAGLGYVLCFWHTQFREFVGSLARWASVLMTMPVSAFSFATGREATWGQGQRHRSSLMWSATSG